MSDGQKLNGSQFLFRMPRLLTNVGVPFTQQVLDYHGPKTNRTTGQEEVLYTEVTPKDEAAADVRVYDVSALVDLLATINMVSPGFCVVDLPDVLVGVTLTYNASSGDGQSNYPAGTFLVGSTHVTFSPKASAQASATVMPVVSWNILKYSGVRVPCTDYVFSMLSPVTMIQVRDRIRTITGDATVGIIPTYYPKEEQIELRGQQVSIRQEASSRLYVSSEEGSREKGDGYSTDSGASVNTVTIPSTIHNGVPITVTNSSDASKTVRVTVTANAPEILGISITNEPTYIEATATGSFSPSTIGASPGGAVSFPPSGLQIVDVHGEVDELGLIYIVARVVNCDVYPTYA